jgi:hypothetical protein
MTSKIARSFLSIVATAMLVGWIPPTAAQAPPPGYPTTLWVLDKASGGCGVGVIPDPVHPLGGVVKMTNGRSSQETIYQRDGFWTKTLAPLAETTQKIFGAGTYLSACIPGQWGAPIKVFPKAPAAPSTNSFGVRWADDASPSTWRYGVQYRIGQGEWKGWKSGTALRSAIFNGVNGKTYFFRARTIRTADKRTDWSPARKVVT